jgi:hypothetical protein
MSTTDVNADKTYRNIAGGMIALATLRLARHWRDPSGGINFSGIFTFLVSIGVIYGLAYVADVVQLGRQRRRLGGTPEDSPTTADTNATGTGDTGTSPFTNEDTRQWTTRLMGSDFNEITPSPAELIALKSHSPPVLDADVQRFLVWRRVGLFVAGICMSVKAVDDVLGLFGMLFGSDGMGNAWNTSIVALASLLETGVEVVACGLCWLACIRWSDISVSRASARVAWLLLTVFPILILTLPLTSLMSFENNVEKAFLNAALATAAVTVLVPWTLSFFPGIIRACLTFKSLMPEATGAGWILMCVSPLYAVVFVAAGLVLLQTGYTTLIAFGLLLIAASSLVYLGFGPRLVRPLNSADASRIIRASKRTATIMAVVGFGLVLYSLSRQDWLVEKVSLYWLAMVVARVAGGILLLNIVAVDLALVLQSVAYRHAQEFHQSELAKRLEHRLAAFAAVNLTAVGTEEVEMFRKVSTHVGRVVENQRKAMQQRGTPPSVGGKR